MGSLVKLVKGLFPKLPLLPVQFATCDFPIYVDEYILEEEQFDEFKQGQYYPATIGEVLISRYQILGKLGFGTTSTVWLARQLKTHDYAALKIYIRENPIQEEFEIYQKLSKGNSAHPGYNHIRTALDTFTIPRPGGDHECLVQEPMWDSLKDLLLRNDTHRFTPELLRLSLLQILLGLDYLHTQCKLVHTDIKADNILLRIADEAVLEAFVTDELESPSPRKFVDGIPIFASVRFRRPSRPGLLVLSDFGSAVSGAEKRTHDAQPKVYRCPEVMLETEWSYPADIWNVGAMVWDLYEGKHMFYGKDPDGSGYKTRAHLAEVMAMLGPPPLDLLSRGARSKEFFDSEGKWIADIPIPTGRTLEDSEENLQGKEKEDFLRFMKGMLQWRPEDRKTARELLEDP